MPRSSGQNPGKAGPDTAPQTAMAMSSVVLFQLKDVEILGKPKQFIYKTSRLWIFHFQVGSPYEEKPLILAFDALGDGPNLVTPGNPEGHQN